ncbi:MAG: hypothetical protein U1E97_12960 [Alphaproteobacteria bacterium]
MISTPRRGDAHGGHALQIQPLLQDQRGADRGEKRQRKCSAGIAQRNQHHGEEPAQHGDIRKCRPRGLQNWNAGHQGAGAAARHLEDPGQRSRKADHVAKKLGISKANIPRRRTGRC